MNIKKFEIKKKYLFAGIAAIAIAALGIGITAARAETVTYDTTPSVGWYYGTGNNYSPSNTAVGTDAAGIELALRAHERTQLAPASVGDTYSFALGQDLGADFSVNLGAANISLAAFAPTLTIFDVGNNHTQSFNLLLLPDNTFGSSHTATNMFQNSEALGFSFMDSLYNKNVNDTFHVTLSGSNGDTLGITLVQGTGANAGVPEPATWALMIAGFGGMGAALRRRRAAAILA